MKNKRLRNQEGSALILVLLMMTALLGSAGWLALQTRTETSVVVAVKNYAKTFNVADGALQIAVHYLLNYNVGTTTKESSWNKKIQGGGEAASVNSIYNEYINKSDDALFDVVTSPDDINGRAKIYSYGPGSKSDLPPGWGLSETGHNFIPYTYAATGRGELRFGLSGLGNTSAASQVRALLLLIRPGDST